jgi:hypothetical protein
VRLARCTVCGLSRGTTPGACGPRPGHSGTSGSRRPAAAARRRVREPVRDTAARQSGRPERGGGRGEDAGQRARRAGTRSRALTSLYGFDGSRGGSCQLARRMENILCQARTAGVRRGEAKHGTHGRRQGGGGRNAAKRQELRAAPTSLVCVTSCSAEIVQVLEYAKCLQEQIWF